MILRSHHGWQLILADLSLILFLVTLTALVTSSTDEAQALEDNPSAKPYVAPAHALFRQVEGGPSLGEWLGEQAADSRATLTIIAQHGVSDSDSVWQEAQLLAQSARPSGVPVRVVITSGQTSDVYASLAYDAPKGER